MYKALEMGLNNDEFKGLIPHLQLEDIFLIEIKKTSEWTPMFESVLLNDGQENIRCNLCNDTPIIKLIEFDTHLKWQGHIQSLDTVNEFYHPVFTPPKSKDDSFSNQRDGPNPERDSPQNRAKHLTLLVQKYAEKNTLYLPLNDIMNITCHTEAKSFSLISIGQKSSSMRCVLCNYVIFADLNSHFRNPHHLKKISALKGLSLRNNPKVDKHVLIQTATDGKTDKFDEIMIEMLLRDKPPAQHMMHLVFEMPFVDLFDIDYLAGNAWRPMLAKSPNQPSLTKCLLCGITCTNYNLKDHLMGKQHKKNQLLQDDVRHKTLEKVTKYSIFSSGPEHKIKVSLSARKKLRDEVEIELKRRGAGDRNVSKVFESWNKSVRIAQIKNNTLPEKNGMPKARESASAPKKALMKFKSSTEISRTENSPSAPASIPAAPANRAKLNIHVDDALVGVEYVVKIVQNVNDPDPMYECCLCEMLTDEYLMQEHLTGYDHRYKYCELHYSAAFKKYISFFSDVKRQDMYRVMGPVLGKIAFGIEEYHGRGSPRIVEAADFTKNRPQVIAELYSGKHACQMYGPSFTNLFTEEEIQKFILEKDFFTAPAKRAKGIPTRFSTHSYGQLYCNVKVRQQAIKPRSSPDRTRSGGRPEQPGKASRAPKSSPIFHVGTFKNILSDERKGFKEDLWQRYRQQMFVSKAEIEHAFVEYRKNPESHPMYDQEWNCFWKQRKTELSSMGIDYRSYNFQPEWVNYFKSRIEQLFDEAIKQANFDVRERLGIPADAEENRNPDIGFNEKQLSQNANEISNLLATIFAAQQPPPEANIQRTLSAPRRPAQTFVKIPQKKQRMDTDNLVKQWNSQANRTTEVVHSTAGSSPSQNKKKAVDETPDVRLVLRLMAALEDHLGSLGPKITELLYISLSLDKAVYNNPSLLERKILTPTHCSLLETAVEKLKGILYADLLECTKKPGFKQVIKCTTQLLDHAEKMGYRQQSSANQGIQQPEVNFNLRNEVEEYFEETFNMIAGSSKTEDENVFNRSSLQYSTNSPASFTMTSAALNAESGSSVKGNTESCPSQDSSSVFFKPVGRINKGSSYERFQNEMEDLNMANIDGRTNINNTNQNNNNSNYQQISYPCSNMSNRGNGFGQFNSTNWNHSSNSQPFMNTKSGGQLSELQKQNLKQLELLRQQQQQRQMRQ